MESWETRWRRAKGKRGVSPIIATILLVAITVVLAAVLYILVSGYIGGTGAKPQSIGFAGETPSSCSVGSTVCYNVTFSVTASSGLTTSMFGLKVTSTTGLAQPVGTLSCVSTTSPTAACTVSAISTSTSGWGAILFDSSGSVVAVYSSGSWTVYGTSTTTLPATVSSSDTISILSTNQLAGSGDTLSAFGAGGASVSGSTTL